MKHQSITPEFVDYIPEKLSAGHLYISKKYRTASHLCCCGCSQEIVTPLNPAKWELLEHPDGTVSLFPSIGNWSFPCRSHYFIKKNRILWAMAFSERQIAAVKQRDLRDAVKESKPRTSTWISFWDKIAKIFKN